VDEQKRKQKEQIRNLLFSSINIAAMTSRENYPKKSRTKTTDKQQQQ